MDKEMCLRYIEKTGLCDTENGKCKSRSRNNICLCNGHPQPKEPARIEEPSESNDVIEIIEGII